MVEEGLERGAIEAPKVGAEGAGAFSQPQLAFSGLWSPGCTGGLEGEIQSFQEPSPAPQRVKLLALGSWLLATHSSPPPSEEHL